MYLYGVLQYFASNYCSIYIEVLQYLYRSTAVLGIKYWANLFKQITKHIIFSHILKTLSEYGIRITNNPNMSITIVTIRKSIAVGGI